MTTFRMILLKLLLIGSGWLWAEQNDPELLKVLRRLAEKGLRLEGAYTLELMANLRGGRSRGGEWLDNVDLMLTWDAAKTTGATGLSLFLYVLGNQGGDPSLRVGDFQIGSNIEAPDTWKVYEAWIQQNLWANRLSLLAGLYDLNSEFDVVDSAAGMVHSSFGIGADFGQSGLNGPSIFPTTSLGLRLKLQATPELYLQGAVLDGVPGNPGQPKGTQIILRPEDGLLLAAEAGYHFRPFSLSEATQRRRRLAVGRGQEELPSRGKVAVGLWYYTTLFEELPSQGDSGTARIRRARPGIYVLAEGLLVPKKPGSHQGLALFGRVGTADEEIHRYSSYLGGGLVYRSLWREGDELAFGVASARHGAPFRLSGRRRGKEVADSEIALELSYRLPFKPWVTLQPVLQYVIHPTQEETLPNALVAGFRLILSLE